jgi:hypothetical protein
MFCRLGLRWVGNALVPQAAPNRASPKRRGFHAADPPSCESWASVFTVVEQVGGGLTPRALGAQGTLRPLLPKTASDPPQTVDQ